MTHRTINSDAGPIQVFDTAFALVRWVKRNAGDCIALARGKFYFQRKAGFEMTVRLNATDAPENRHLVAAANDVAEEVEAWLSAEKAAA